MAASGSCLLPPATTAIPPWRMFFEFLRQVLQQIFSDHGSCLEGLSRPVVAMCWNWLLTNVAGPEFESGHRFSGGAIALQSIAFDPQKPSRGLQREIAPACSFVEEGSNKVTFRGQRFQWLQKSTSGSVARGCDKYLPPEEKASENLPRGVRG
jgi:hypothetical protein